MQIIRQSMHIIHAYNPDAVVVLHYIDNILKDDIYDDCVGVE